MTVILRQEWFGGLLADTATYDIRVVNQFTYQAFAKAIEFRSALDEHHRMFLKNVGFTNVARSPRLIYSNKTGATPILSAPVILWLELTDACPLKCKQCFKNCQEAAAPVHLPFYHVKKIIEESAALGIVRITLTGGEAFSYPHIEETIAEINAHGMGLRIFTNGIIKKEFFGWLDQYEVDTVFLSIDGPERHHDYLRGINSYRHAINALENLSKMESIKNITLSVSLDIKNAGMFEKLFELAERYGVKTLLVRPLMGYSWTPNVNKILFKEKYELFYAIKQIESLSAKYNIECQLNKIPHMPIDKAIFVHDHKMSTSLWNIIGHASCIDCVGGNMVCGITCDGFISPCGFIDSFVEKTGLNSTYIRPLEELWHSAPNLARMRNIKINTECQSCSVVPLCHGGCRANAFNSNRDISGIDPYCLYMDTAYGGRLFERDDSVAANVFPIDKNCYYISEKRMVTKCGWASYG